MRPTIAFERAKGKPTLTKLGLALLCMGLAFFVGKPLASSPASCPAVGRTPSFTIVYGVVTVNGSPASVGAVVTARDPRGMVVGCFVVAEAGMYGSMFIYGEDTSVEPPAPGMREGEAVIFGIDSRLATPSTPFTWTNDRELYRVDLAVVVASTETPTNTPTVTEQTGGAPTLTPTVTPTEADAIGTLTPMPSSTSTSTTVIDPGSTLTLTSTPASTPSFTATTVIVPDNTPIFTPTPQPTGTGAGDNSSTATPISTPTPAATTALPPNPQRSFYIPLINGF